MEWLAAEVVLALLVLLVSPLVGLYVRRRWLSSRGGVFDCALRLREGGPGTGWAIGVARYEGDELQWFRTFSLSTRPRLVLRRDRTTSVGTRTPSQTESLRLFQGDRIMQLQEDTPGDVRTWDLAMNPAAVTGLMSWLEAAPPGGDRYSGLEMR